MKDYRFYIEEDGRWFIDLPEWTGEKAELQMVAGADIMLDSFLDNDSNDVWLTISEDEFENSQKLTFIATADDIQNGAYYVLESNRLHMWLCDVTKFVFGGYFPETIYLKKKN